MSHDIPASRIQSQLHAEQLAALNRDILQGETEIGFEEWADGAFNPVEISRKFLTLPEAARKRTNRKEETEDKKTEEGEPLQVEKTEAVSEQFEQKNPELDARALLLLRSRIKDQDSKEDILRKVLEMYPDYSLADEAIDFLLQTTKGKLGNQVRLAKEMLHERYGREVRAGRNMAEQARTYSSQGLGTPTGLRGLYREVTGNPRDSNTLFNELSSKFEYEQMKKLINFLLHSLGSDLKSKGPSIDHAELHRLITETRKLQAILGIFRFFKSRMALIASAFARQGVSVPKTLSFEALAKLFMKFLQERYPAPDKVLQMALQLGLDDELLAQIIVFTQMRDGVRGVAPKLFKSELHRQDVLKSFMDAIEELDEELDEDEEKEKK